MTLQQLAALIQAISVLVAGIAIYRIYVEYRKNHDWNRRKAAHDLLFDASAGKLRDIRAKLETKIAIHDTAQTYTTEKSKLSQDDHILLDGALNYLENICLTIKNGVADEAIIYESLAAVMISYHRWALPYIRQCRSLHECIWVEIDPYTDKWSKQLAERTKRMVGDGRRGL